MIMLRPWHSLFACVLLAALPGCNELNYCTFEQVDGGLYVELSGPDDMPLTATSYTIALQVEGTSYEVVCNEDSDVEMSCTDLSEPDDPSDFRVGAHFDEVISVRIWRVDAGTQYGPRTVNIEVLADGVSVAAAQYAPVYESSEPNGEGCGVVESATETLEVPPIEE